MTRSFLAVVFVQGFQYGGAMSQKTFTSAERHRFRNLLELAERTPFPGERTNAIAAAQRMADRRGLTLEEAARDEPPVPQDNRVFHAAGPAGNGRAGFGFAGTRDGEKPNPLTEELRKGFDRQFYDKMAFEESRRQAYARGLDANERRTKRPRDRIIRRNNVRRDPVEHACMLLRETQMPFTEVAAITELNVYKVIELKLKLRKRRRTG